MSSFSPSDGEIPLATFLGGQEVGWVPAPLLSPVSSGKSLLRRMRGWGSVVCSAVILQELGQARALSLQVASGCLARGLSSTSAPSRMEEEWREQAPFPYWDNLDGGG